MLKLHAHLFRPNEKHVMRVVFLGTPFLAVPALRALAHSRDLKPLAVFTQPPARRSRRGKAEPSPVGQAARELGLPCHDVHSVNEGAALEALRGAKPDVIVVVAFGQILRRVVLELPEYGCINFHPSLLPAYRGAAPIQRAVMDGVTESGLTIMRLVRKLDAGPILAQQPWHMNPDKNADELLHEAGELAPPMLLDVLRALPAGVNARQQDDAQATYAPPIDKEDGRLDFHAPAHVAHNRVRAVQPWPRGQTWLLRDTAVRVLVHRTSHGAANGAPGEILGITRDAITVACKDGTCLNLHTIQLDGKPARPAGDVANGLRLKVGERFGQGDGA
jgi:methionyl-tRNA formyltransferase